MKPPKVVEDAFWQALNDDAFHNGPMLVSTAGPHTLRVTDRWDAAHIVALQAALTAYNREVVEPLVEAVQEVCEAEGIGVIDALPLLHERFARYQSMKEGKE